MSLFQSLGSILGIFFHPRPEGWWIIGAIVAWSIYCAIKLHNVERVLRAEAKSLEQFKGALSQTSVTVGPSHVEMWLAGAPPKGLVDRAIRAIWAVRVVPNPDLEAIGTMLAQSEAARLGAVRNAPNRLLLLGLLGTVAGLAGVVGTLGPQIQGTLQTQDPLALTQNLANTLRHMENAFSCTAWGILSAICVAWYTGRVAGHQSNFLADVQAFGMQEFAPRVFPASQEAQLDDVRRVLETSREFLQQVAEIMSSAAQRFETVLTGAGAAMTQSVQSLENVAAGMQHSLTSVAADVRDSAAKLERSASDLHEYHTDLKEAYNNLLTLFNQSKTELEEQAREQLAAIGTMQQQFGTAANEIVVKIGQVSTELGETTRAIEGVGDRVVQSGSEIHLRISQGFTGLNEGLGDTLQQHRREMERVEENLRVIGQRIADIDPRLLPVNEWQEVKSALVACTAELGRIQNERGDMSQLVQRLAQIASLLERVPSSAPQPYPGNAYPAPNGGSSDAALGSIREAILAQNPLPALRQLQNEVRSVQDTIDGGVKVVLFKRRK